MLDPQSAAPSGTVTFLFTDIEGSTTRWDSNREAMQAAVRRHDELLRGAIERNSGYVFKTIGDAFCAAFPDAEGAIAATLEAQRTIGAENWDSVGGLRVRMALHTGIADERNNDYFGPTVNRVARLLSIGHGGQVLVSGAARALIDERHVRTVTLIDLGMHRLKDLSTPEHVFQIGAEGLSAEFPALRSLDAVPNNLPAQLTALIGRDEELAAIKELIASSRLVTLLGSGGIGKTRLALQAAADLAHADGAWFVDLAAYEDASLVPSAIAEVFNVADEGGSQRLIERVATAMKSKDLLIVLDNCEHVVAGAAEAVDYLLRACPDVRVLATSREALGIHGEEVYRMPSLSIPPASDTIAAEEAMRFGAPALFVARARASQKSFDITDQNAPLVVEIVRRLDGIALAIELAAARVKVLNLTQLAQRLDDRLKLLTGGSRTALPRQQTLRALIAWSYDLLAEVERSVLRQLAAFRGSFTLEAAGSVWEDANFPDGDILDLIAALADKSLLVVESNDDEQRYRLLESTREFALESLVEAGEFESAASRHCAYYSELATQADSSFWKTDSDAWMRNVRGEIENYRVAMKWALKSDDSVVDGTGIFIHLRPYWALMAGREGRSIAERVNDVLPDTIQPRTRALFDLTRSRLTDSGAQATVAATEAVRLLQHPGEEGYLAEALVGLAGATLNAGDPGAALPIAEQAITAARKAGVPRQIGFVLSSAAYAFAVAGEVDRATAIFKEAEALIRRSNDRPVLARMQMIRAEMLLAEGDIAAALDCVREAEAIYRERGNDVWLCYALLNETAYLLAANDSVAARTSAREALQLARRRDNAFASAVAIGHLARIAAESSSAAEAAKLLGFVDSVYAATGSSREPTEQRGYERCLEVIRGALPEDRVAALLAEGAAMDAESAAEEAMAIGV